MLGPTAAALAVPPSAAAPEAAEAAQLAALEEASRRLDAMPVDEYYSGCWITLSTLLLAGDVARLAPMVRATPSAAPGAFSVPAAAYPPSPALPATCCPGVTLSLRQRWSHGFVVDASEFVKAHPGGLRKLLSADTAAAGATTEAG